MHTTYTCRIVLLSVISFSFFSPLLNYLYILSYIYISLPTREDSITFSNREDNITFYVIHVLFTGNTGNGG